MIKRKVVALQQHTHPASHKNSALRVGLLFIDMAKIAYPKHIKSFDDQISILKSRGMVIKDEARAKQILAQVQKPPYIGYA